MVSVLQKEIHARGSQSFQEPIDSLGSHGRLDDREGPREQEFALPVRSEKANSPHRGRMRAPSSVVQPCEIVCHARAVDADGHTRPGLGEQVQDLFR